MSDTKISALPSASSLTGAERLPVSQSNQTRGATTAQILSSSLFTQTGTGAVARSINNKYGDIISAKDFGAAGDGSTNDFTAITNALAVASVAAAKVCVYLPQGNYNIGTSTLVIPSGVSLRGASRESSFITYTGSGNAISINSAFQFTLSDLRISLGSSATIVGLSITTTSGNTQYGKVSNIEIATGGLVAGQIGMKVVASGGSTLTDCWFEDINIASLDKPIVRTDTEGNIWKGIIIDTWGTGASVNAVDAQTHAEFFQARIATASVGASCVAYKQTSNDNIDDLVIDSSASATALNVTGTRNKITLSRTNNNTPLGTISAGNVLVDASGIYGTPSNDDAAAGYLGEYKTTTVATGSSQSLTSPNALNVTSVSLTAGDWNVWGVVDYTAGGATTFTVMKQGISTTSATIGAQDTFTNLALAGTLAAASDMAQSTPVVRISLASTTTVYLVAQATFAASTLKAYGTIFARRVR